MLTDRILNMRNRVRDGGYRIFRNGSTPDIISMARKQKLSLMQRCSLLTQVMCRAETPLIFADEKILFTRTTKAIPPVYGEDEFAALFGFRKPEDIFLINNICGDWGILLGQGLLRRKEVAQQAITQLTDTDKNFLESSIATIDAVLELASRYAEQADKMGKQDMARILRNVPAYPAQTFHEALQSIKFCHSMLWLSGHFHVGLGRFDQYMYPYYAMDIEKGNLTEQNAKELIAEFFISLNKDSDLYFGVQRGDNGQSLMLGGVKQDGSSAVNRLTYLALEVSRDLGLIDPKINLRVDSSTPKELLVLSAELTEKGLGFPQYSNDERVIPGLVNYGYLLEDAREYSVAACWEFVIPGKGLDFVNIGAVSFPAAVDKAIRQGLRNDKDIAAFRSRIRRNIFDQVKKQVAFRKNLYMLPAPFYSVFFHGALEKGVDISQWTPYRNLGIHGAASANAADAVAAVKELVFDTKHISGNDYINALNMNYEGFDELRNKIAVCPKTGNNDQSADEELRYLFDCFAEACRCNSDGNGLRGWMKRKVGLQPGKNTRCVRPGSGSAMFYLWLARGAPFPMLEPVVGATADGRRQGDFFSASLGPAHGIKINGPLSVLKSFAKIDYNQIVNGGPITLELSTTVFKTREAVEKVADLIKIFVKLGCQQLQLNTLNAATLEDAREHPAKYKNLIVRVWGWSGYFCELAPEYQDHIIARHKYALP